MQFALIKRHPGESVQTTGDWYTAQSKEAGFDLGVRSATEWPSASDREDGNPFLSQEQKAWKSYFPGVLF